MSARDARFKMRLPAEKLNTWREFAAAEGRTLTTFVELAVDGYIDVQRVIAANETRERQRAARFAAMDPVRARELDFGRTGRPDAEHGFPRGAP